MLGRLESMIREVDADFVDIRYEIKTETVVSFVGREIKSVGSNTTDGFVVRVLREGGFSSATVTREEDVPASIRLALEGADTIRKTGGKRVTLADVPVVEDVVKPPLDIDPREVEIDEKIRLTEKYNEIMLDRPETVTTRLTYREVARDKHYVNSQGTAVSEVLVTTNILGEVIAGKDGVSQNVRVAIGGADGFRKLLDREELFHERSGIAAGLLDARSVKGGTYDVVLNPGLAGVFTHEAFGHFSEADIIEDNPGLRNKMVLGAELGSREVTIVADSTLPGQVGYYKYDDEGVLVKPVTLMNEGVLTGRLHSRATAAGFGEPPTGHAVAEDMRFEPIVRMGTIFIKPGGHTLEELLRKLGDGLYLLDGKGGQTSGENFTFGAQYGFIVEGGKVGPMIRDVNIMGNLFTTLKSIEAVGNEMVLSESGGCGKGQINIKSALGGPSVLIREMVVGGA